MHALHLHHMTPVRCDTSVCTKKKHVIQATHPQTRPFGIRLASVADPGIHVSKTWLHQVLQNHSPFGLRFPDVREAMPLCRGHELIIEDLGASEQKRRVPFIRIDGNCAIYVYPGAVQSVNRETSTQSWARGTSERIPKGQAIAHVV